MNLLSLVDPRLDNICQIRRIPHTNSIQLPVLRFMHIWLGITLFPRDDIRFAKIDDLKLMLCTIKRVKVSPVQLIIG
jgi:hypothetical protein